MAGKRAQRKGKKAAKPRAKRAAAKGPAKAGAWASSELVQQGLHDLMNLSTAVKAYLELLVSQSRLEDKQKYYVDRAREQVEMIVDLIHELREKL